MELKRVGNRWVHADMANDWAGNMKQANEALAKLDDMTEVEKQQALGIMRTVQAAIRDLQGAKDVEDFKIKAAGPMMGLFMGFQDLVDRYFILRLGLYDLSFFLLWGLVVDK